MTQTEKKNSVVESIKQASKAISDIIIKDNKPTVVIIKNGSSHSLVKLVDSKQKQEMATQESN